MTEFSSSLNEPSALAIRNAERSIMEAINLTSPKAIELGRSLIEAKRNFSVAFRNAHPSAYQDKQIQRHDLLLSQIDAGETEGLKKYLNDTADSMLTDQSWLESTPEEEQEYPERLKELARAILD